MAKILLIALASVALVGCDSSSALLTAAVAPTPIIEPAVEPIIDPPATPPAHKALLSAWTRIDSYDAYNYTVDLSGLVDLDTGSGVRVDYNGNNAVSFYFGYNRCIAEVWISGSQDNGTLEVRRINSGSTGVNATYCNQMLGTWEYVALSGDQYRMCLRYTSTCHTWQ